MRIASLVLFGLVSVSCGKGNTKITKGDLAKGHEKTNDLSLSTEKQKNEKAEVTSVVTEGPAELWEVPSFYDSLQVVDALVESCLSNMTAGSHHCEAEMNLDNEHQNTLFNRIESHKALGFTYYIIAMNDDLESVRSRIYFSLRTNAKFSIELDESVGTLDREAQESEVRRAIAELANDSELGVDLTVVPEPKASGPTYGGWNCGTVSE